MSSERSKSARRASDFGEQRHSGRGVAGTAQAGADSQEEYSSTRDARAATLARAKKWRERNPGIWAAWERAALGEAAQERRFSMKLVMEQTRRQDRVDSSGEPVKLNNSHGPIWARMLASEHPEIRPYIELRRCYWDIEYPNAWRYINGTV